MINTINFFYVVRRCDKAQADGLLNKHGYLKPPKFRLNAQACDECIFKLLVPAGSPGAY